tara:strand:+ start:33 stop:491 length:459 start_codon:yes stop_codon:yes gene_type:complete
MPIATKSSKFDISKESDTAKLAKKISKVIKRGDILFFYGEIGVGKTTFIKYLINYLQHKKKLKLTEIPSPTFNLLHEYKIKKLNIHHYDLYRIKNVSEIKHIGLFENYKQALTFVEWPEIIKEKPKKIIKLIFKYEENLNKRTVKILGNLKK